MQEKSKNIFDNSKEGTIGARIRVLMRETGKSVTQLEEDGGIGNGTLKTWKEKSIEFSSNVVDSFKRNLLIDDSWWKTGEGKIFLTSVPEPAINEKEKDPYELIRILTRNIDRMGELNEYLLKKVKDLGG